MMRTAFFLFAVLSLPLMAFAGELRSELPNEARMRVIAGQLRCPVCQGETVFDSHSGIAVEMKAIILEKIEAGESDEAIINFFKERYGDFVLMRPEFDRIYAFIWLAPFLIVGLTMLLAIIKIRNKGDIALDENEHEVDVERVLVRLREDTQ